MTPDIGRCYLGYDPGGNGKHGVAAICVQADAVVKIELDTVDAASDVLKWFLCQNRIARLGPAVGIGVDTLTYWSGGNSGWRNADIHLRGTYPDVAGSVASANSLYGSMGLNGMFVLRKLREENDDLYVTETHPKVLYRALVRKQYASYPQQKPTKSEEEVERWRELRKRWERMNPDLASILVLAPRLREQFSRSPEGPYGKTRVDVPCGVPSNDHEWDALISAWAAYRGREAKKGCAKWKNLVDCETEANLDFPARKVEYRWPGKEEVAAVKERLGTPSDESQARLR